MRSRSYRASAATPSTRIFVRSRSSRPRSTPTIADSTTTIRVALISSACVGHDTFAISARTATRKSRPPRIQRTSRPPPAAAPTPSPPRRGRRPESPGPRGSSGPAAPRRRPARPPAPVPSLRLFVQLVRAATGTEFLPFHPLRMHPPVLVGEVVPTLAVGALQNDLLARHMTSLVVSGWWVVVSASNHYPLPTTHYLRIFVTTPAPTVRPPSRIANRSPSSIAIGVISSIVIWMLSPGITISTPAGSSTFPVTSVVRK